MTQPDPVSVDELTPDEILQLMANAEDAAAELDRLVALDVDHRANTGCAAFGCNGGQYDLADYESHQLAQLLAVALGRLAEGRTP